MAETLKMAETEQPSPETRTQATPFKYSKRMLLKTIIGREDGGLGLVGETVVIGGWVKSSKEEKIEPPHWVSPIDHETHRVGPAEQNDVNCIELFQTHFPFFRSILKVLGGGSPHRARPRIEGPPPKPMASIAFLQVSDGSCVASLQVVVDSSLSPTSELLATGTCLLVEGLLKKPSEQGKYVVELKAQRVLHVGTVDPTSYVFAKKRLPLDMLRSCLHFRARTTTVASVMRIRSSLTFATHTFFKNHGFLDVQVPVLTSTDSEGFSEKIKVRAFSSNADRQNVVKEGVKTIENLKNDESVKDEETKNPDNCYETYLIGSGRLHLGSYAAALGNVYAFGPRFRANRLETPKHAAEMWMAETEMAFSDLEGAMNCANDFFKFICKWVVDNCADDMRFICKRIDKTCIDRLHSIISEPFPRITYTQAVEALTKVNDKMEVRIDWGFALTTEHLSYLADEIYKSPVIIYDYPREVKPFNTRLNDDGKTVAAFDMIVPKVGKLIAGSQTEERVEVLNNRIKEVGLGKEQYEWYLDLRRHGTVQQSGFSFAFDIMLLLVTGLADVRDVIPFPKSFTKRDLY